MGKTRFGLREQRRDEHHSTSFGTKARKEFFVIIFYNDVTFTCLSGAKLSKEASSMAKDDGRSSKNRIN